MNGPARGMELREVVRVLERRRMAIATGLFLGLITAIASILAAPIRYSATATVEMNRESGSALGLTDLSGTASALGDAEGANIDLLTQQAVLLSDNTALAAIEKLNLDAISPYALATASGPTRSPQVAAEQNLPLDRAPLRREHALKVFRSGLRVNPIKGTRLLMVTYTDTNAERAATIANTIVDAYMSESTRARFQASSKVSGWLSGQLTDLKKRVEESQDRVDAFRRESGLADAGALTTGHEQAARNPSSPVGNVALTRFIDLNHDLTRAEVTRIAREAIYTMTQSQDPEVILSFGSGPLAGSVSPDSPVSPGSADLVLLQQLRERVAQVKVEIATAGTKYGARNPAMVQLANQQTAIEAQIRTELDHIRARAKNDLDLSTLDERGIQRQIAEQERIANAVAAKGDRLLLLQEEARSSREIYQDLYTKLEEASVTAGSKASNIALIDPARPPATPSYPRKRLTLTLGCIAGLTLGLLAAFAWDYFDDSLALPEDAERITGLPVIGAIPDFRQRGNGIASYSHKPKQQEAAGTNSDAWLIRSPHSHTAEAYRALRTALLLSRADTAPSTILFLSGSPAEGKSTTCLNTAAAFAAQGDRVLYLDADLRRSKGDSFFHCSNDAGLSNCLASGLPFLSALQPHPAIATLFLLPAGPHPPNPSELLGSKRFADLLGELRTHFDYIFIDSPPVLLVTDAQLIAPLADGCVLVVRAHKTLKRLLDRTLSLLQATKTSTLGIVVNAFTSRSAAYSAYGYYGERSGYYAAEDPR